jgi:hypothetical protein
MYWTDGDEFERGGFKHGLFCPWVLEAPTGGLHEPAPNPVSQAPAQAGV